MGITGLDVVQSEGFKRVLVVRQLHQKSGLRKKVGTRTEATACRSSNPGDVVLNPFCGSGLTLVA